MRGQRVKNMGEMFYYFHRKSKGPYGRDKDGQRVGVHTLENSDCLHVLLEVTNLPQVRVNLSY